MVYSGVVIIEIVYAVAVLGMKHTEDYKTILASN